MEAAFEVTLNVSGMHCSGCAATIKKALSELEGVYDVTVDLDEQEVTVTAEEGKVAVEDMERAVVSAGYGYEGIKEHT